MTTTLTQNAPRNVTPQLFAGDLAVGEFFDFRTTLCRDLAPSLPLADKLSGDVEVPRKVGGGSASDGEVFAQFHRANDSTVLAVCNSNVRLSEDSTALSNAPMRTIEDIRHEWLLRLIDQHGSLAALNAKLDRARNDATLQQIKNKAPNTRTGKIRSMGGDLAREIEEKLGLERGTLDNPPPAEISNEALEFAKAYDGLPQRQRAFLQEALTNAEMAAKKQPPEQPRQLEPVQPIRRASEQ